MVGTYVITLDPPGRRGKRVESRKYVKRRMTKGAAPGAGAISSKAKPNFPAVVSQAESAFTKNDLGNDKRTVVRHKSSEPARLNRE